MILSVCGRGRLCIVHMMLVDVFVAVTNKQESQKLVVTPRPPPTLPAKSEAAGRHTNLC